MGGLTICVFPGQSYLILSRKEWKTLILGCFSRRWGGEVSHGGTEVTEVGSSNAEGLSLGGLGVVLREYLSRKTCLKAPGVCRTLRL